VAVTTVIDQVCHGTLSAEAAQSALESAGRLPPASTPRFTLFAAIGAASLGVIFGTLDATSLLLIATSAAIGALVRRWLSGVSNNPLIQPLCAAFIAGVVAAAASRFQLSHAATLVAFCPCMVLVPGPHILNGAIDLARTRIALGIARLTYAGVIVLLICAGLLFGFAAVGANLAIGESSPPVPLVIDVIAAGCAAASFGTFFSMPWRLLAFPIAAGMLAHAARWALISVAGGKCSNRRARRLHARQRPRDAGRRPLASAIRGPRLLRGRFDDARLLHVPCCGGSYRIGLDRTERAGYRAVDHRLECRHGFPGYHGHDLWVDPAPHAVRAFPPRAHMIPARMF